MDHFGVQCVLDQLQKNYLWRGMGDTMVATVQACLPCAQVKTGFTESRKELQPLPIRGLGYRWGVYFASPMEKIAAGNTYVLVCIEHFTKWVELIPLPSKCSKDATRPLLKGVLRCYAASDQGSKFKGEFQTKGSSKHSCPNTKSRIGLQLESIPNLTDQWKGWYRP